MWKSPSHWVGRMLNKLENKRRLFCLFRRILHIFERFIGLIVLFAWKLAILSWRCQCCCCCKMNSFHMKRKLIGNLNITRAEMENSSCQRGYNGNILLFFSFPRMLTDWAPHKPVSTCVSFILPSYTRFLHWTHVSAATTVNGNHTSHSPTPFTSNKQRSPAV